MALAFKEPTLENTGANTLSLSDVEFAQTHPEIFAYILQNINAMSEIAYETGKRDASRVTFDLGFYYGLIPMSQLPSSQIGMLPTDYSTDYNTDNEFRSILRQAFEPNQFQLNMTFDQFFKQISKFFLRIQQGTYIFLDTTNI